MRFWRDAGFIDLSAAAGGRQIDEMANTATKLWSECQKNDPCLLYSKLVSRDVTA
jgi:hypothetical protein